VAVSLASARTAGTSLSSAQAGPISGRTILTSIGALTRLVGGGIGAIPPFSPCANRRFFTRYGGRRQKVTAA